MVDNTDYKLECSKRKKEIAKIIKKIMRINPEYEYYNSFENFNIIDYKHISFLLENKINILELDLFYEK